MIKQAFHSFLLIRIRVPRRWTTRESSKQCYRLSGLYRVTVFLQSSTCSWSATDIMMNIDSGLCFNLVEWRGERFFKNRSPIVSNIQCQCLTRQRFASHYWQCSVMREAYREQLNVRELVGFCTHLSSRGASYRHGATQSSGATGPLVCRCVSRGWFDLLPFIAKMLHGTAQSVARQLQKKASRTRTPIEWCSAAQCK